MTSREKSLLRLLVASLVSALTLWGVQMYLDSLVGLDQQFATLQKQASRELQRVSTRTSGTPNAAVSRRFWDPGTLPEPLTLAKRLQPILASSGVAITEFEVQEASATGFRLRYHLKGAAQPFFQALARASSDPKLLHHRLTLTYREAGTYDIEWEVGYAALR